MAVKAVTEPFGKWESPITIDLLTGSAISYSSPQALGENDLYFLESRPFEAGRSVLVTMDHQGRTLDVVGKDVNVRTKVHEYGGGGYVVDTSSLSRGIVYSEFKDSRLYWIPDTANTSKVEALTPANTNLRFASFSFHPTLPVLVAVCENHSKPAPADVENYLVLINLQDKSMKAIVKGSDFYSNPVFSPSGKQLVWTEWMHPEMPWTSSDLYIAQFDTDSTSIASPRKLAGGSKTQESSIAQPRFTNKGILIFACDITGYSQLYKSLPPYETSTILADPVKGEFTPPDWQFGYETYTIVEKKNEVLAAYTSPTGETLLGRINLDRGILEKVDHPFLTIDAIHANPYWAELVYITGSTKVTKGLFSFYAHNGDLQLLRSEVEKGLVGPEFLSLPRALEIPLVNGGSTYGFYYPPTSATHRGPEGSLPPLLMRVHGGPTGFAKPAASFEISYWTSRGYAFFTLNYGGSAGYGREYRQRLNSTWGLVDMHDAIESAQWLSKNKYCDGGKMAIDGGSAGGFTVLNVLCHSTVFAAGCSLYGVSELSALTKDTHKFESQYLFNLVGGTPQEVPQIYHDRSPLYYARNIKNPIMLQQGTDDFVVPINQAEMMVKEIEDAGGEVEFLVLEGEGHGFRGDKALRLSLQRETDFFQRALAL